MPIATSKLDGDTLTISLNGRIDSSNAAEAEREVVGALDDAPCTNVVIDASQLEYVSSAGLRIVLRLRKRFPDLIIENVSTDVYEILDMTGFTEMVDVRKAYRVFSVDGCEVIGKGANGSVYRVSPDTIVKVYNNPEALPEIQRERELARTAFVLGVPTAIPYDVVRVGDGYGSVYELLDAKNFAELILDGDKTVEEIAQMSAELLRQIHSTTVKPDSVPDMKKIALGWADFVSEYLPQEYAEKLRALVEAVPESPTMLHGDFHVKNIMYQNGESLLIDMDTICHGNPVFELGSVFNAYVGFSLYDNTAVERFFGLDNKTSTRLWHEFLGIYLETSDEERIAEVESKAQIIGLTRLIRRNIRRGSLETEKGADEIEFLKARLEKLLDTVDTLIF